MKLIKPEDLASLIEALQDPCHNASAEFVWEYDRARKTFGAFHNAHEGYAVLLEEVDELWDAIKAKQSAEYLRREAVQVGAMALAFIVECCDD